MNQPAGKVVALLMACLVGAAGCSHEPTPRSRVLREMHELVPNDTDDVIITDAYSACGMSRAAARRYLLDDSMAAIAGVNELPIGSAELGRYADRLIDAVHRFHFC